MADTPHRPIGNVVITSSAINGKPAAHSTPNYRWVILALAFSAFAVTFLDRLAWGNANLLASKSIALPVADLGLFVTGFYGGYVAANALSGFLTDRIGSRRVIASALALLAVMTALFGFTTSVAMGFTIQVLMGVFAGVDYAGCGKLIASWFLPSERGLALGIFTIASSVAVAIANGVYPIMLQIVGWQPLYWSLGLFTGLIAIACLTGLRDSPLPTPSAKSRSLLRPLLRNRNLVLIALAGFGANWGTWGFAFWATALMVRGYQISPVEAGYVVLMFAVAAILSKPLYGLLSDLLGGRRLLTIVDLGAFAAMLAIFGQVDSLTGFLIAAPFLGFTAFVYQPLMGALITETVDNSVTGSALGLINAFWQLGSVIVPSAVGLVFAATSSFQAAFLTLAVGPLIGMLCMLPIREKRREPTPSVHKRAFG